jgi:diguanylate cyclase (GGDEF)-like protein
VPIVVLSGVDDELLAIAALKHGAQDYLVKGEATARWLYRAIKYAGERNERQKELWELALFDEVTGLYNRRGFRVMAERECRALERSRDGLVILAMDLDGLKAINDTHGHAAGDAALQLVASALRQTLRKGDISARVGGDEFLSLARGATPETVPPLLDRFTEILRQQADGASLTFPVSASAGWAYRAGPSSVSLEQLLLEADESLYGAKSRRARR